MLPSLSSSSTSHNKPKKRGIVGGVTEAQVRHRNPTTTATAAANNNNNKTTRKNTEKDETDEEHSVALSDATDVTTTAHTLPVDNHDNDMMTRNANAHGAGGGTDAGSVLSLDDVTSDDNLSLSELEMQPLRTTTVNKKISILGGGGGDNDSQSTLDEDFLPNKGAAASAAKSTSPVKYVQDDHGGYTALASPGTMRIQPPVPTTWSEALDQFLFPPKQPRECQLLRPENIAVPACYLLVGLLQGLSGPLINVFPLDIGATEAQQTTVSGIRSLPATFKLFFGFWSDNVPLCGYRRKPYMLIGWLLASFSMLVLYYGSNLHAVTPRNAGCFTSTAFQQAQSAAAAANYTADNSEESDSSSAAAEAVAAAVVDGIVKVPVDAPSVPFLSLCFLCFGIGFWLADVMGDSIVAEKAKLEPEETRGSVQSTCYSYRFFGQMLAAPASSYVYTAYGPGHVVALLLLLPLCILPLVGMLGEVKDMPVASTRQQCGEIWNTVCSRAVWQPMAFVYLYNLMQVGNSAWREFLVTVLHFTSCHLNLILITSYILLYAGILAYKYCFMASSWRRVYIFCTLLNGFFSSLQVLLIYGWIPAGISPFWFALGDDAFAEFISGIQFLPTTIMMVHLCPAGSEGASYAMFTTVNNSALNLSSALSTMLLGIWDVSRETLQTGDLTGMLNLTYLTTLIQISAIALVGWLPHYKQELVQMQQDKTQNSVVGGFIFLFITAASLVYAITVGALNIVSPGWMGES